MKTPTVSVGKHRGRPYFVYRLNGKPRYRTIVAPDDPKAVERQRVGLMAEIMAGPRPKKQKALSLEQHILDFLGHVRANAGERRSKDVEQRLRRTLKAAGITAISQLAVAKIEPTIHQLRKIPRKPKADESIMPLMS